MKRTKKFLCFLLVSLISFNVYAGINFGSTQSAIKVSGDGRLHLADDMSDVDGSIILSGDGQITGEADKTIDFDLGVFESNKTEMVLDAELDPNLSSLGIELKGNDLLRAEPGTIIEQVKISSSDNRLLGQPMFQKPLLFADANASLTIAINSKLNQNIQLNNGTIFLEQDLRLSDSVTIEGDGRIKLNNNTFAFGGKELTLANNIFWENASDEELNGKLNLAGVSRYSGVSVLNGNGNILDLSTGGTILVEPASTLYLTDIVIKGLGDGFIIFGDEDSQIFMSKTTVELATSYTTTIGKIHVEGPTTFVLEDNDWHFDTIGSLTVDGVVLWTDRRGTPTEDMGHITFGTPESAYFSSIDSGTIKAKTYLSDIYSLQVQIDQNAADIDILEEKVTNNSNAIVLDHELTVANSYLAVKLYDLFGPFPLVGTLLTDTSFYQSAHIHPDEQIIIGADLTINGNGSMGVFSNPDMAQFIVQPGKCVTLQNINFQNINANTFQLGSCSCIKIGPNVTFGITEDVLFKGRYEIVEGTFTIYGVGGIRRIGFNRSFCDECAVPDRDERRDFDKSKSLKIGTNTLSLKNIELMRIEDVTNNVGGIVKLCGESIINFHENNNLKFMIEGVENIFRFRNNGLSLIGSLNFGNKAHNALSMIHKVPEGLTITPYVVSFADNFAYLNSEQGVAELTFDDDVVRVVNGGNNAFVAGNNSFLGGRQLQIWDYPIRQISDNYDQADDLILSTNLDSATKAADGFYQPEPGTPPPDPEFTPGLIGYSMDPDGVNRPRIFRMPFIELDETVYSNNIVDLKDAFGEIVLDKTVAKNFSPHEIAGLNITLKNGSVLEISDKDAVVKEGDMVIVSGKNNVIHFDDKFTINGELLFEKGSSLRIESENKDAIVYISENAIMSPEANIEFVCKVSKFPRV